MNKFLKPLMISTALLGSIYTIICLIPAVETMLRLFRFYFVNSGLISIL